MKNPHAKRENFVKQADKRTQAALSNILKIGDLADPKRYDYSQDDLKKISKALDDAKKEMEQRFAAADKTPVQFSLEK